LPPFLREVKDFQAIMSGAEQSEFAALWDFADALLAEQFLDTATKYAVKRWERFLGFFRGADDTLTDRKFAIKARLQERPPYTMVFLKSALDALIGAGNYEL
jgi:uncharacterized protein YmfQ (DUF2313 family)